MQIKSPDNPSNFSPSGVEQVENQAAQQMQKSCVLPGTISVWNLWTNKNRSANRTGKGTPSKQGKLQF